MKKRFLIALLVAAASTSIGAMAGTRIGESELPAAAVKFMATHYPGYVIVKAEKDQGRRGLEYEVDLKGGAELEFKSDGEWKEVKAPRGGSVPAAIVPSGIAKYVSTNFKNSRIVEISRRRGGYEVELSDGTELHLTADGKPSTGGGGSHRRH